MKAAGMTWGFANPNWARVNAVLTVAAADGPCVVKWLGLQNPTDLTLNLAPASDSWVTLGN